jgi:beta-glucosidase-like glycosyl hydrolase/CubicO group peptidase (beta-lactamase class C family)
MFMRIVGFILVLILVHTPISFESAIPDLTSFEKELEWVTDVYDNMSIDQKLGQLFMIRAYSKGNQEHEAHIEKLIKEEFVGGLCFFQGSPSKQLELTNRYQSISQIPLLISIDAEWGLGMRLKSQAISFPHQLTLGALKDNKEIYQFGLEVADQLKRLGIHMNFAPVVDINSNPENPVINNRSFGEDRQNVTGKSFAYMRGMQDGGILACAKHFPGHGDTDTDSHYDLPLVSHSLTRLDSLEMFPFKVLAQHGMASVMIAHLSVPALDSQPNLPSTLSKKIVTDILKEKMDFKGLVVTDALDMNGVTKFHKKGELEAKALEAGNDILLLSEQVALAKQFIKLYIDEGRIDPNEIENSVKKILHAKYRLGLYIRPQLDPSNLKDDLFSSRALGLNARLYENAITLVRDDQMIIPIEQVVDQEVGVLSFGVKEEPIFQKQVQVYAPMDHFHSGLDITSKEADFLFQRFQNKDLILISLHNYKSLSKDNHGIGYHTMDLISSLALRTKVVLVLFGSPYALNLFDIQETVVMAYESNETAEDVAAQAIFGVSPITGRLPIRASEISNLGAGVDRKANGRLGSVIPEVVGLNSDSLALIDSLVAELIQKRAAPGCQVLVAKDGRVVFQKSYGHHDYRKTKKVELHDVYDLASITKIAATTISLMKLYDEGKIDIDAPLKNYLTDLDTTNKGDLIIKDILAHHAGLIGWIPFYESTKDKRGLSDQWYRIKSDSPYTLQVCEKIYLHDDYLDTIYTKIVCSDLRDTNDYRYSDLGFYLFDRLIQKLTGKSLNEYASESFYKPLGLHYIGYNPLLRNIPMDMIPPTEKDNYFRSQTIKGYVHDMGAAMQSGVAGHAGLFSNSHDLAVVMQMLLNEGEYGGKRYLKKETVRLFTSRHHMSSRRGLGFDMKELDPNKTLNMCEEASPFTFGHMGFTGTSTWSDPANGLVFVFLSNRTYPRMNNNILHRENYRPKLQSIVYRSLIKE